MTSVYEKRGLLGVGSQVEVVPGRGLPIHPYLPRMTSFCGACPIQPVSARCEGCPVTAAEVAQLKAYSTAAGECLVCGSSMTKPTKRRRRVKENP